MTVDRRTFVAGVTLLTVAPSLTVVASTVICSGCKRPPHRFHGRRMEYPRRQRQR